MPESLRALLRSAGRPLHEQVDAAYSALSLSSPSGYRRFLRAQGAALLALEALLDASGAARLLSDWPVRRRSAALCGDLAALGDPAPRPLPLQGTRSPSWCWGALYVLEGSRLGGQLLVRQLQEAQPQAPRAFLESAALPGLWPSFLTRLESHAPDCSEEELLAGMREAFELFIAAARRQASVAEPETVD